jgi:hypothetical protein
LDVEYQASKPRTTRVLEESLGGGIRDCLEVRRPEQPAHRAAEALVIINDRDIDVSGAAHSDCSIATGKLDRLLPFREGR